MTDAYPPAPPAPSTPVPEPGFDPKRGRGRVIWGSVLLALGVLVVIGGFAFGISSTVSGVRGSENFTRVDVPGEETVTLPAGKIDIWAERSLQSAAPIVRVEIVDPKTDDPLQITSGLGATYNYNGRYGARIGTVRIPEAGDYTIRTFGTDGATAAFGNLDLGGLFARGFGGVFGGLCFGGLFLVTGLVLLIVGLVARSKTKAAMRAIHTAT